MRGMSRVMTNRSHYVRVRARAIYSVCTFDAAPKQKPKLAPSRSSPSVCTDPTASQRAAIAVTVLPLLRVEDVPVGAVQPSPQITVTLERDELVAEAVAVPKRKHVPAEARLDLIHELRMGHLGVYANGNEVVRHAVEDLDLQEGRVGVRRRDGRIVCCVRCRT